MSVLSKIAEIEAEMARTQKNKATAGHLGMLKAKLAKLRRELIEPSGGGGGGAKGDGFEVNKVGDARVGMVGFPSVGKSTLLTKLTGTFSEAASYEFTTLTCVPGMIRYKGAKIQLLDLPGIIEGAKDGKGRGRQVIATARTCNLIIIVLDCLKPITHKRLIEHELEGFGIRLNKKPPEITYKKKDKGGINFTTTVANPKVDLDTVKRVLGEYRVHNADIHMRGDYEVDDIVDVIEGRCIYIPCIYAINKIDQITLEELNVMSRLPHYCPVSSFHEWNMDGLVEMVWKYLDLTRVCLRLSHSPILPFSHSPILPFSHSSTVLPSDSYIALVVDQVYTKPKGRLPDWQDPVVMPSDRCTVEYFCNKLHKAMIKQFKYALVWGASAKHRPQRVGKEHMLEDEDIVQIVKKV